MKGKIVGFERNGENCTVHIRLDGIPETIQLDKEVEVKIL